MQVADVMQSRVVTIPSQTALLVAKHVMQESRDLARAWVAA